MEWTYKMQAPKWFEFVTFLPKGNKTNLRVTMPTRDIDFVTEDKDGKFWIIRKDWHADGFVDKYIELSKEEYVSVMSQLGFKVEV